MALGGYTAIKFDTAHIERVFCASPLPRMDDLLGVGGLSAVALPAISNESEAGFHGQPAACYRQGRRMTHDHHLARSTTGTGGKSQIEEPTNVARRSNCIYPLAIIRPKALEAVP